MNERQKEILQSQLNSEKQTISELQEIYQQALDDCNEKIRALSARADMEDLQSIVYQRQYQEALKKQIEGVLENMHSEEFTTISDYLTKCYSDGFVGTMYDLHGQGIPVIMPMNQRAVVAAIQTDSKISTNLYTRLGEDVNDLKKTIRTELSRGIANGSTWNQIASDIAGSMKNSPLNKALNNSIRIARTEGHRVQIQSALDAQHEAKKAGADIVKQWDSTLDGATRRTHQILDGQIRELDDDFEVDGKKAEAPGMFGRPEEDINCRCALLQRARWALDQKELDTLKERADYYGLDKTKDFDDFSKKYLKASRGLGANDDFSGIPDHKAHEIIKNIDINDEEAVNSTLRDFERDAVNEEIETACVITKDGTVYKCYGTENKVFPDADLGDKLKGAIISHNHPDKATEFSFSELDFNLFDEYDLVKLRGIDYKYEYELTRTPNDVYEHLTLEEMTRENNRHEATMIRADRENVGYMRKNR